MSADIPTLLAAIDLAELAERDGVVLRGGAERSGACPLCGGRDRFHVKTHDGRGYFFCRKCHPDRGDAIEYMRWAHGMSTGDAIRALGGDTTHPAQPVRRVATARQLDEFPPCERWQHRAQAFVGGCAAYLWTPGGARALAYLRSRGLADDAIRRHALGYNPAWRKAAGADWGQLDRDTVNAAAGITIPHQVAGQIWAVRVRRLNPDGTAYAGPNKYVAVTGSRPALFNADGIRADGRVIMFEGEFDAMLAQQHAPAGVACVTFGSESKAPSPRWLLALRGLPAVIAYDADDAGERGAARWLAALPGSTRARVPTGKDITDLWRAGGDAAVSSWLREVAGMSADMPRTASDEDEQAAIIDWLFSAGYEPRFGPDGRIVAARPEGVPA